MAIIKLRLYNWSGKKIQHQFLDEPEDEVMIAHESDTVP